MAAEPVPGGGTCTVKAWLLVPECNELAKAMYMISEMWMGPAVTEPGSGTWSLMELPRHQD
jgi:hypothetical protein